MKGLFLTYVPCAEDKTGVGLKIKNQIKCFNNAGLDCLEHNIRKGSEKYSRLYRFPFMNFAPQWKYDDAYDDVDYLYFRRPFIMTGFMRSVLRNIKKNNPRIKIVMEIPTFPYDEEIRAFKMSWMLLARDRFNRKRLKGLIDYIALLTDEKEVFGIPTIKIWNGIDIHSVRSKKISKEKETINMCAVAIFKEWHGYERLIRGLADYYRHNGKRRIIIHFVGDGTELPYYKQLVKENKLDENVIFYGILGGEELARVYDKCSLSLGAFGAYKKNIFFSCELKSREAVARGIPSVIGCHTDIFEKEKYKYFLEFPNDDSDLDIKKIIEFHDRIYSEETEETVIKNIREYARKTVDMDSCMGNVINYFKS